MKRTNDLVRAKGAFDHQTLLRDNRSEKWFHAAQNGAYNTPVDTLLEQEHTRTALILVAYDLWFKNTFSSQPFIETFFILQGDMYPKRRQMMACLLPLLVFTDCGVCVYYSKRMTPPIGIEHALGLWNHIIRTEHNGIIFKNIPIRAPT